MPRRTPRRCHNARLTAIVSAANAPCIRTTLQTTQANCCYRRLRSRAGCRPEQVKIGACASRSVTRQVQYERTTHRPSATVDPTQVVPSRKSTVR